MDRHICKAKDVNTREWVYGYYVAVPEEYGYGELAHAIFDPNECEHICMSEYKDLGWYEVDPDTVCQCTGWIDSHQTPIFEKDIVKFVGASTDRILVCWCSEMNEMNAVPLNGIMFDGYDYWNGKYPKCDYSTFCLLMQDPYGDFKEIKVVGNIVDNPELLEEV